MWVRNAVSAHAVFSCGRSLYIDWRMVVVVGGGLKREGELSWRGKFPGGGMSEGEMSRQNCLTLVLTMHSIKQK